MRVVLLAQFFPPEIGGEERHVHNLAEALAARGHHVAVATQRVPGVPDTETLPSGVRIHRIATATMRMPGVYSTGRPYHPPLPDPVAVRELARVVAAERPDVVHAHNWIVNSAIALRRDVGGHRFKLVLTLHDYSQVCATKRLMRDAAPCPGPALSRCPSCVVGHYGPLVGPVTLAGTTLMRPWKSRAVDHVVSVSRAVATGNRIAPGPHSSVIPNFVPDALVLPAGTDRPAEPADAADAAHPGPAAAGPPDGDFLLFVGDLSQEKGVHTLIAAHQALPTGRPPLLLVGRRTPDTPPQLPDDVLLGVEWRHDQVLRAFRRCLFAVLPSTWPDPCPTTVLEAMASARPVITTKIGGMVDMVVHDESGLLVEPGDAGGLTGAMARLLDDPGLRDRLGAGALRGVAGFTASRVVERLEQVYRTVTAAAPAAPLVRSA